MDRGLFFRDSDIGLHELAESTCNAHPFLFGLHRREEFTFPRKPLPDVKRASSVATNADT